MHECQPRCRPGERGCEIYLRPHPEELAKQASRRMDATHGLAAILRDARKGALLRMRSIFFRAAKAGDPVLRDINDGIERLRRAGYPPEPVIGRPTRWRVRRL